MANASKYGHKNRLKKTNYIQNYIQEPFLDPQKCPKPLIKSGVSGWCGKQDLKSEAAVNNASFCIIWYKVGIESDKIDQYHTL